MPFPEPYGPRGYGIPAGLRRFHDHLLARFPGTRSGGMYNPGSVTDSGSPSRHTITQALDIMCDAGTGALIMRYVTSPPIAESVNLQQCISHHEIITVQRWNEGIRHYAPNDHAGGSGHAHIEMGWQAALHWESGNHSEGLFMALSDAQQLEMLDYLRKFNSLFFGGQGNGPGKDISMIHDLARRQGDIKAAIAKLSPVTAAGVDTAAVAKAVNDELHRRTAP